MDRAAIDQLEATYRAKGPHKAVAQLCSQLEAEKDYAGLFYALLLQKRHELGVSPLPTASTEGLSEAAQSALELAIRDAARQVGNLHLRDGEIAPAWTFFRMIEEPGPIREALEAKIPDVEEDVQNLVQVAYYEGVHPRKGFDWILERYGICSAITTLGSQESGHPEADRRYCVARLIRSLYAELRIRLTGEIEAREGRSPPHASQAADTPGVIAALIKDRDWLFEEDSYHIDTSHLSSVVQMSLQLEPCPELALARELCAYGKRLTGRFLNPGDPPFEDLYGAHDRYLAILQGESIENNLDYFRDQAAKASPEEVGTYPAEVLVNLLLKLNRPKDALAVARKYLSEAESRRLSCPGIAELCQKVGDFRTLAEVARDKGDSVHFLAGLLASNGPR
jgi:hypothetical protein